MVPNCALLVVVSNIVFEGSKQASQSHGPVLVSWPGDVREFQCLKLSNE